MKCARQRGGALANFRGRMSLHKSIKPMLKACATTRRQWPTAPRRSHLLRLSKQMQPSNETMAPSLPSVPGVLAALWRAPARHLLWRWNWKAALLSACVRGMLFFLTTLKAGFMAAIDALLIEAAFY